MEFSDPIKSSNTSISDVSIHGGYGRGISSVRGVPGLPDEKQLDPNIPFPVSEVSSLQNSSLRRSIVSWFKRSSQHNALNLNPLSRTNTGITRTYTGGSVDQHTVSDYSTSPVNGVGMPSLPVLERVPTDISELPASEPPPAAAPSKPESVFSRDDAKAYYANHWTELVGDAPAPQPLPEPAEDRLSTASSWTAWTRTTMQAGARESGQPTAGLSPPSFYMSRTSGEGQLQVPAPGSGPGPTSAELEGLREQLLALYAQGEKGAADSEQQQQKQQGVSGALSGR